MVHVSETCESTAPHLLTHVHTTTAAVHEAQCTAPIQQALGGAKGLPPSEHLVDAAYIAWLEERPRATTRTSRFAALAPVLTLPWEAESSVPREAMAYTQLWASFLQGGYPELAAGGKREITLWHASYVQTYLERDVRAIRQIGDLSQFQIFLRALAARSAQLLNLSELARDLGVAVNTVKAWLSVLEATYQVLVLRPYFANVGKRLVKSPKVYFADVGTLCYLAGLKDPEHAMAGPMGGAILETAVVHEIVRTVTHTGQEPQIYFWRTATGTEVDVVVDIGTALVPIEVKLSATPHRSMAKGIEAFRHDIGARAAKGYMVHPGDIKLPLGPDAVAWPFSALSAMS